MSGTGPRLVQYAAGWGVGLWLVGYVLGIVFFGIFPTAVIGWMIMPIGLALTIAVLLRVKREPLWFYAILSVVWAVLAMILDYVFIVKAFSPADGYYKADVYVYYALTFCLPLLVGVLRTSMPHQIGIRRFASMLLLNMAVVALCVAAIVMASLYWAAGARPEL